MTEAGFDRLAKAASIGSRRRLLGALLLTLLTGRGAGDAHADEGVVIADASGGDGNDAVTADVSPRPNRSDEPDPRSVSPTEPCRPEPVDRLCQGRCGRLVADGCGSRVRCTCAAGEICGPGNRCCPREQFCQPSNACCALPEVCAAGGGVCCPPENICEVNGVPEACCSSPGFCLEGFCVEPV